MAVGFDKFDVDKEREKLRKLSDAELIREGKVGARPFLLVFQLAIECVLQRCWSTIFAPGRFLGQALQIIRNCNPNGVGRHTCAFRWTLP